MADVQRFQPGNYRFISHAFQYSGGVEAMEGYAIERVRFAKPLKLAEGFAAAEAHMARHGRPPSAFCACELRSPGQFTDQGFIDFNRHYVQQLAAWGIFHDDVNPVARSNVCPEIDPPSEPSFYAFSYTVPGAGGFVIAGSGEAGGAEGPYGPRIVRLGDTSPDGMRDKARFVLRAMEQRMDALDKGWARRHRDAALYGLRDPRAFRRRIHPPPRCAGRPHLALRAAAGAGPRLRGRCPRRRQGAG